MALSPLDIRSQSFTRRLRGLDADEVGAFLAILAEHYDDLQRDVQYREARIADLESKLVHYERIEEALQEALRTARESQRHALDAAAQKAEQIRVEATLQARSVVQDAENDRNRLRSEAQAIGARRQEIVARLRAFLMSEMEMLAHFEGEDPVGFIQFRRDGSADGFGPAGPLSGSFVPSPQSPRAPSAERPEPEAPRHLGSPVHAPEAEPAGEMEPTVPEATNLSGLPDLTGSPEAPNAAPEPASEAAPLSVAESESAAVPESVAPPAAEAPSAPLPSGVTAFTTTTPEDAPAEPTATYTASLVPADRAPEPFAAAPHGDASVSMPAAALSGEPPHGAFATPLPASDTPPFGPPPTQAPGPERPDPEPPAFEASAPATPAGEAGTPQTPPIDAPDVLWSDPSSADPFAEFAPESFGDETSGDDSREIVRPSWMDDVPTDLLAAPLFAPEPAEAPIPAALPPAFSAPPREHPHAAPPDAARSPLAERLARAAADTPPAAAPPQSPPAPVSEPMSVPPSAPPAAPSPEAPAAHAARPRYVVTSFLGDASEPGDRPATGVVAEAESEEIARVRRLLDGLG